jgi:hypothetical protein
MSILTKYPSIIVLVHLAVTLLHGAAHRQLGVNLETWQNVVVLIVILLGPFVAWFLIRRPGREKTGYALLAATMAGSFVFGVYFHFVHESFDHISHRESDLWGITFTATAVLLAAIEAVGFWLGFSGARTSKTNRP